MTIIPREATPMYYVGEVTVQYNADTTQKRERVTGTKDAFYIFRQYWSEKINYVEEFYVMCLNGANEVVGIYLVSTGGATATMADPKIVFQVALGCHATSIIIAHNHPSGNMEASPQDIDLTHRYQEIGKLMYCPLLDHLILGPQDYAYFSFADERMM